MRRFSLRVGLSVFASATLLGGGSFAAASEKAPEEHCQLTSVLDSDYDADAQNAEVDAAEGSAERGASACEEDAAVPAEVSSYAATPVTGAATHATMFGGISLALVSASAAFAGIDWTPILIKLGSMF